MFTYRMLQSTPIKHSAKSISVTIEVNDLYLSVAYPSHNQFEIFKYTPFCNEQPEGTLSSHKLIEAKGVTLLTTFSAASRNYLAINGEQAEIFIFDRNGNVEPDLNQKIGN